MSFVGKVWVTSPESAAVPQQMINIILVVFFVAHLIWSLQGPSQEEVDDLRESVANEMVKLERVVSDLKARYEYDKIRPELVAKCSHLVQLRPEDYRSYNVFLSSTGKSLCAVYYTDMAQVVFGHGMDYYDLATIEAKLQHAKADAYDNKCGRRGR